MTTPKDTALNHRWRALAARCLGMKMRGGG